MLARVLLVALGGAFGAAARYVISVGIQRAASGPFPWHTLVVNVVGSFGLGVLLFGWPTSEWMTPAVRLGLTTGVMGGFTTYSTFNYETLNLLHEGDWGLAGTYILTTLFACAVAGTIGMVAGRAIS